MSITSLYRDYFQKSRTFLYPALGIRKGVSVTPVQTYTSWKDIYDHRDRKLSIVYHLREDDEFKQFEENKLLNNPLFHDFKPVGDGDGVYVFSFDERAKDWDNFLIGRYSRFTKELKETIKVFHKQNSANFAYVDSFLHPEKYFGMYADFMSVDEKLLREVGELCSVPDFEEETLNISIKHLEISEQSS